MWNWSVLKTAFLGITVVLIVSMIGLSWIPTVIISTVFTAFALWVIKEINFVRNAHGNNIEELQNDINELKKKVQN